MKKYFLRMENLHTGEKASGRVSLRSLTIERFSEIAGEKGWHIYEYTPVVISDGRPEPVVKIETGVS